MIRKSAKKDEGEKKADCSKPGRRWHLWPYFTHLSDMSPLALLSPWLTVKVIYVVDYLASPAIHGDLDSVQRLPMSYQLSHSQMLACLLFKVKICLALFEACEVVCVGGTCRCVCEVHVDTYSRCTWVCM